MKNDNTTKTNKSNKNKNKKFITDFSQWMLDFAERLQIKSHRGSVMSNNNHHQPSCQNHSPAVYVNDVLLAD